MAYIPFQQHFGEGAAVKLRTPQAPDWTAKYQLAAQERRAREAARAQQEKDKRDLNADEEKSLRKTLADINPDFWTADTPAIDNAYNDIWKTFDEFGGNFQNPDLKTKVYKQVWDLKQMMDASKDFETRADKRADEVAQKGVDLYDGTERFEEIKTGKFAFEKPDGTKAEYDISKVKTPKEMAAFNAARQIALDEVSLKFDPNQYMGSKLTGLHNAAKKETYITLPNGNQEKKIEEDPYEFSLGLKTEWGNKKAMQKFYENKFAENPMGYKTPYDMFHAEWYPFKAEDKISSKFAPASSTYGQGATDDNWQKSAGKTSTFKFGNGLVTSSIGNYTITETPVTFKSGEAIDIKTGKKYTGSVTDGTMGQVQIIPINSKTGEITTSGATNAEYIPMVVVKVAPKNKWEEGEEILLPVSVGRGAAESKESKEEREALKKRFDWSEDWAKQANEGIKERDKGAAPEKQTQAEWNAAWSKLKKGETMVGLNGVTYTKK